MRGISLNAEPKFLVGDIIQLGHEGRLLAQVIQIQESGSIIYRPLGAKTIGVIPIHALQRENLEVVKKNQNPRHLTLLHSED